MAQREAQPRLSWALCTQAHAHLRAGTLGVGRCDPVQGHDLLGNLPPPAAPWNSMEGREL